MPSHRGKSTSPTRAVVITAALASNIITLLELGGGGAAESRATIVARLHDELDHGPTFKAMEINDLSNLALALIGHIGEACALAVEAAVGEEGARAVRLNWEDAPDG